MREVYSTYDGRLKIFEETPGVYGVFSSENGFSFPLYESLSRADCLDWIYN